MKNLNGITFLSDHDQQRLGAIAKLIELEAQCWEEGFAIHTPNGWIWNKEYPEQHARVIRLKSAVEFLLRLSTNQSKTKNAVNPK